MNKTFKEILYFLILLLSLNKCSPNSINSPLPPMVLDAAWILYVLNFTSGDSTIFKNKFPNLEYADMLEIYCEPLKIDTIINKNAFHISFLFVKDSTILPGNIFTFHAVGYYPNNVTKIYAYNNFEFYLDYDMISRDSILTRYIVSHKNKKFSNMLVLSFCHRHPEIAKKCFPSLKFD